MNKFDFYDIEFMAARFKPFPTQDNFLDNRYNWQAVENHQEWPYYRFFYHLSKMLKPALVVELGGFQGTAAAHFAAGNPGALVITIDHHTDPGDELNKAKMTEACEHYKNILYVQGWTNAELTASQVGKHALGDAPNAYPYVASAGRKIDILFIDSWHVYEQAVLDYNVYKPLMASPSLIICDDIQGGEVDGSPVSGMLRFWDEMPEPKFLNSNLHPSTNLGFMMV